MKLGLLLLKLRNSQVMLNISTIPRKYKELVPISIKLVKTSLRLKTVSTLTTKFSRINLPTLNMRSSSLSLMDGHNILRDLGTMLPQPIRHKLSDKALITGLTLLRLNTLVMNSTLLEIFSINLSTGLMFLLLCKSFLDLKEPRTLKKNFPCSLDSLNENRSFSWRIKQEINEKYLICLKNNLTIYSIFQLISFVIIFCILF